MADEIKSQEELRISENKINDYCSKHGLAFLYPGEDDGRCDVPISGPNKSLYPMLDFHAGNQ